ncbi:phytanoyl-CoA dioxygenase, partial [Immersiella caudata]
SQLTTTGYTHIPSFLSPSQILTLRAAASTLTELARQGHWPHVRTVGKQFPPWPSPTPSSPLPIWGIQHLLHPSLPLSPEHKSSFTKIYFETSLLTLCTALVLPGVSTNPSDLVMELFNMLITPGTSPAPGDGGQDFELRWHRDAIPWSATTEEEEEMLGKPAYHTQYNIALYDDDSLVVVPGSHSQPRTEAERNTGAYSEDMPGASRVVLKAGDVVFYDNNILHRGVYKGGKERATLHGSVGHVGGSTARARNVLQHGIGGYVGECDFGCLDEGEREVAEGMRRRLFEMGKD